jgi:hypothetical protein
MVVLIPDPEKDSSHTATESAESYLPLFKSPPNEQKPSGTARENSVYSADSV